jgi:hypothetical protein
MKKNRVTAGDILIGFVRGRYPGLAAGPTGWSIGYTQVAAHHYGVRNIAAIRIRRSDESPRAQKRLRSEIATALDALVRGVEIDWLIATINKHTRRPSHLFLWEEGTAKTHIPYRTGQPSLRTVSLSGRKYRVFALGYGDLGARQFLYSLIRQTVEDGTVERFKFCRQCKEVFYQRTRKAQFCTKECHIYFYNHWEPRKERYLDGKWYPADKKMKGRSRQPKKRA